jgi:hypothetical protein
MTPTARNGWSSTTCTAEPGCPTASCQPITASKPWTPRDGDGAPFGPAPEQGRDRARPPASVSPALRPLLTGARSRILSYLVMVTTCAQTALARVPGSDTVAT